MAEKRPYAVKGLPNIYQRIFRNIEEYQITTMRKSGVLHPSEKKPKNHPLDERKIDYNRVNC